MKSALLTVTVASFAFAGLVPAAAASAKTQSINATYTCTGGQVLQVTFEDGQALVARKKGKPMKLTQSVTADGFEYKDDTHSLRGKGDNATWTKAGYKPLQCTAMRLK